ncbi:MAG: hypothetical protein ACP5O3_01825 [Candidatus Micrarchaeia archaeon]
MERWKIFSLVVLAVAVALSCWSHSLVLQEFYMPTFGNTGMHAAPAREFAETGFYPRVDYYSYGGGIPFLYVPLYRVLVGASVILAGVSVEAASRLGVMVVGALSPLAFFALARKMFGERAGLFAAFLSLLPAELLIYTVRPLPQAVGMLLVPLALLAVLERKWVASLLLAAVVALTHQETALFLAGGLFLYGVFALASSLGLKGELGEKREAKRSAREGGLLALCCWGVLVLSYFAWQFAVVGHLNVFATNQFAQHEGVPVGFGEVASQSGVVLLALFFCGVAFLAGRVLMRWKRGEKQLFGESELLALALVLAGVALVKNDWLGLRVLMQRFIVYLDEAMVLVAAFGAERVFSFLAGGGWRKSVAGIA